MKRLISILPLLCLLLAGCEKDYDDYITVGYPVASGYTELDVSDAFEVVMCDTVSKAMVSVRGGEHKNVVLTVEEGTLKVGFRSGLFNWFHGKGRVLLPVNSALCDVELSGASTFRGDLQGDKVELDLSGASGFYGNLQGREVNIDLSGASDFEGGIDADEVELEFSGSSSARCAGSCMGLIEMEIAGSSSVYAYGLECRSADVRVSGSSTVQIACCERITGHLSGSSDLYYKSLPGCNPVVDCATSGSSEVHRQ